MDPLTKTELTIPMATTSSVNIDSLLADDQFNDQQENQDEDSDFPFTQHMTKDLFDYQVDQVEQENDGKFDADLLLYQNYRFMMLEDLRKELGDLLDQLDDQLVDLINRDYQDFITLGQSVGGTVETIQMVKFDVTSYKNSLASNQKYIDNVINTVKKLKSQKTNLSKLKWKAEALVLLHTQVDMFEKYIAKKIQDEVVTFEQINKLTSLYLSITSILDSILEEHKPEDGPIVILEKLKSQVNSSRYEYQSIMDTYISGLKSEIKKMTSSQPQDPKSVSELQEQVMTILTFYPYTGNNKLFSEPDE